MVSTGFFDVMKVALSPRYSTRTMHEIF